MTRGTRHLLWALLLWTSAPLWAADGTDSIQWFAETANRFNRVFPQEKVYLHLDNTGYFMGETLWMKAYMVRTDKDSLGSLSRVLYVELLDPFGEVVKSQKLKVENGMAHGDIELTGLLTSGFYELRAYTRYMMNWGGDGIFSRVIPIFSAVQKRGEYDHPKIGNDVEKRFRPDTREGDTEKARRLNVRFYPEGGHLVEGLRNRVAFAITNKQGGSVEATCRLMAGDREVARTATQREGRGVVEFDCGAEPLTLHVDAGEDGKATFPLPASEKSGCSVTANTTDSSAVSIGIAASADLRGQKVGVAWTNGGHTYSCLETTLGGSPVTLKKAYEEMRDGVNQLTVIDEHGRILASRLLWVYPRESVHPISVTTTDTLMRSGRQVKMEIDARPNTTFSMAITDAGTQTGGWNHNAATWLLLTSDLRGYIRNPEYYLEANDAEHRAAADLLMMVQGWRRYDFKTMEGKSNFHKQHGIEDRLYIDGKVHIQKRKKTVDNVDMVLALKNDDGDRLMGQTRTDAKGNFAFAVPDCYNNWELMLITAKNQKFENYLVGINRMFAPTPRYISEGETEQIEARTPRLAVRRAEKDHEGNYTILDGSISLQQVDVTAKRKMSPSALWEREDLGRVTASLRYDCEKEVETLLDQGQPIPSLIQFLREKNNKIEGNDNLSGTYAHSNTSYRFSDGGPSYDRCPIFWVVDNHFVAGTSFPARLAKSPSDEEMNDETTYYFPSLLDEVKRVYISFSKDTPRRFLRDVDFSGMNSVTIHVYTNVREGVYREKGVRHTYFNGFNVPKTYEEEIMPGIVYHLDYRRTLYWNPDVTTDKDGHAEVTFTPTPRSEMLLISAEGINSDGSASVY